VTEARAINGDDAVLLGQPFDYPANLKILHHDAVTVQQDKGRPLASLQVMEADSLDIEEVTGWWVVPLRLTCASSVHQSRGSQEGGRGESSRAKPGRHPPVICRSRVTVHNFSKIWSSACIPIRGSREGTEKAKGAG
jgi:hypothetical protein